MPENSATFVINLEGNAPTVSADLATRVDALRQQITGASSKIGDMSKLLKNLKGDTGDVAAAKEVLKAKISAEKDVLAGASAELVKHGAALKAVVKPTEKAGESSQVWGKVLGEVNGGLPSLIEKLGSLGGVLGLVTAAVVGVGAALGAGLAALARWVITTGDARRNTNLMLEAFAGSAKNGEALGTQVDALTKKVPLARDKIAEMAAQLMRTRLGGQQIVDTLNIVGEASTAMGDDVGRALGDIVKRSARAQRIRIDPRELFGTGIRFEDVAAQLAKQLHIGIADAKQQLFVGAVDLGQGAKALRTVVEKRFGEINGKKLLSLDAIGQRLKDTLSNLVSKIDFDRILAPISKLVDLFDVSTVSGKVLQDIFTNFGKILGNAFGGGTESKMKTFFLLAEIAALKVLIGVFKLKNAIEAATGSGNLLLVPFKTLAFVVEKILISMAAGFTLAAKIADKIGVGTARGGVTGGIERPTTAIAPAHAKGGLVMKPAPGEAFASVAPGEFIVPPGAVGSAGGRGGKAEVKIAFHITTGGHTGGDAIAKQLSEPNFLALLTKTIEDACKTAGIPTQTTGAT